MRKQSTQRVKYLDQGHTTKKFHSWEMSQDSLASTPALWMQHKTSEITKRDPKRIDHTTHEKKGEDHFD